MSYDQYDDDSLENDEYVESSFDALPAGEYGVEIESIELRKTKSTNLEMVSGTLVVIEGDFTGRKLFLNYVIETAPGKDPKSAARNRGEVKNLHEILGAPVTPGWKSRLPDLANRPFVVKVGARNHRETGEPENVIRKTMAWGNGPAASAPARPTAPSRAPAPAARTTAPAPAARVAPAPARSQAPAPRPAPGARQMPAGYPNAETGNPFAQ